MSSEMWRKVQGNSSSSSVEKELTETYGLYLALMKQTQIVPKTDMLLDVCSGKGFSALFLKDQFSANPVVAIDNGFAKIRASQIEYLREQKIWLKKNDLLSKIFPNQFSLFCEAALKGVELSRLCEMNDNFSDSRKAYRQVLERQTAEIEAEIAEKKLIFRPIFLSCHPCGRLASEIVKIFVSLTSAAPGVLVLCPCCSAAGGPKQYAQVCQELFESVDAEQYEKTMVSDPLIKSDKNVILTFARKL
jgi:hypothetical protein